MKAACGLDEVGRIEAPNANQADSGAGLIFPQPGFQRTERRKIDANKGDGEARGIGRN